MLITGVILLKTLARKAPQNGYSIIVRSSFMLHMYTYTYTVLYTQYAVQCILLRSQTITVGAQSIASAQSIARRHTTYVIMPKKPKFREFLFGKIKKEEFARRIFKKRVYFCL
jgi:hypothetical protein